MTDRSTTEVSGHNYHSMYNYDMILHVFLLFVCVLYVTDGFVVRPLRHLAPRSLTRSPLSVKGVRSSVGHRESTVGAAADGTSRADRFRAEFQERWIDSGLLAGATVLVTTAHETTFRHEFGTHDRSNSDDLDEGDRIFCVYSMTKVVTSVAVLQLVEDGVLDLDDPVSRYLPSFRNDNNDGDKRYGDITIRHCLSHQAGFDYNNRLVNPFYCNIWDSYRWFWAFVSNDLSGYVNRYLAKQPLLFAPGTCYNYADGANVAAAVVEQVSGVSFAKYVRDHITTPLGMDDTYFVRNDGLSVKRLAGHRVDTDAFSYALPPFTTPLRWIFRLGIRTLRLPLFLSDATISQSTVRGDQGLKSTASDWAKLVRALLSHNTTLLSQESIEELGRPTPLPRGMTAGPNMLDAAPYNDDDTKGTFGLDSPTPYRLGNSFPGQAPALGLNVIVDPAKAGVDDERAVGTCWWTGLASTYFSYNRREGIGCVVLAQEWFCFRRSGALVDTLEAAHDLCAERPHA